jgi:transposase
VGLRPKLSQSGESDPELGITKEGDIYLRKLLVQGAHRILSRAAPDTDLKRWVSGEVYEPLRNSKQNDVRKKAA